MANFLTRQKQEEVARALFVGQPQRSIAYVLDIDRKTVARLARHLGRAAMLLNATEARTPRAWKRIEMDEFYTFILAKRGNVKDVKSAVDAIGHTAHFLAVCADTNYIVHSLVAPTNDFTQTLRFLNGIDERLKRVSENPDPEDRLKRRDWKDYEVSPQLISDGFGSYSAVVTDGLVGFPGWNYWRVVKTETVTLPDGKKEIRRVNRREKIQGEIDDPDTFFVNRVEGMNSVARHWNMRVHDESKSFSKRMQQHIEQFALFVYMRNHIIPLSRSKQTPALLAGVDRTIVTVREFLDLTESLGAELEDDSIFEEDYRAFGAGEAATIPKVSAFWLYHSLPRKTSMIHLPSCPHCKYGAPRAGQTNAHGYWMPFGSYADAVTYGEQRTPGRVADCRMCLGERALPRHGP